MTITSPHLGSPAVWTDARLLHRLLGLTVLRVSTGQEARGDAEFALDAVQADQVPRLRAILLSDSLAADAFGWDNLLERKGEPLPGYFAKSAARKLGDPDWRAHPVKEVKVG